MWLRAQLELDNWRLQPFPELKSFVETRAKAFPAFSVVYTGAFRAPPTLVLRRPKEAAAADGKPAELRLNVGNWKVDQLDLFLKERLGTKAAGGKSATA